jgi:hypothetical protein
MMRTRRRPWKRASAQCLPDAPLYFITPLDENPYPTLFDGRMTLRKRMSAIYALVIVLIAVSFVWQMIHGLCPVP